MFSLFRQASRFTRPRTPISAPTHRSVSWTSTRWSNTAPELPTLEEEAELEATNPETAFAEGPISLDGRNKEGKGHEREISYNEFLKTIGAQYKNAKPNNWLGGGVPFPMNPSFTPPSPLSDEFRQEIYEDYIQDPIENSIRNLSQRHHMSLKRVDAILRLKGLEHSWHKKKQIQYGFQCGMDKLLGVKPHKSDETHWDGPRWDGPRWDALEADVLEQDENRDAQRRRYQRHYWESVPEDGREPIVPAALEHAKQLGRKLTQWEEHLKPTHPRLIPQTTNKSYLETPLRSQSLEKVSRPALEIRDVGGKFLDLNDNLKRISTAEGQARGRKKKHERRKAVVSRKSVSESVSQGLD